MNQLEMFVLDVLHYDIEDISAILRMLNSRSIFGWRDYWPHDFTEQEVIPALQDLIEKGMVEAFEYDERLAQLVPASGPLNWDATESFWFRLTQEGKDALDGWNSPKEREQEERC